MTVKFIISDTETVGLNPPPAPASGVVEVAYLELDMNTLEILDEGYSRVQPGCLIHPEASKVHGISDADVIHAPKLGEVYKFEDAVIHSGHSAAFDLKFLAGQYDNLIGSLCTLALARQYIHDSPNHKLGTLVDHLGLQKGQAHNALADCHMTRHLLIHIIEKSGRDLKAHIAAARKPKILHVLPFGKYKGQKIATLPRWYIDYFADKEIDPDLRYSFDQALKMRL